MAQLLYKTRGQSHPQGKPRVYFACHEQDHAGYFQGITDEILKISDCAIYYYEPGAKIADEEHFLNLGQMQLVVMPVTTRLLYMENQAMDVDFAYARAHHIPILPLMQEKGLEDKYQEKFGDLQFLEKHNDDPTAIPYEEKLKKYLESILVGDELAQKIRAAFDAYIFLSYRKKDRKYAQELMRLLHRDPVCRDIAIWYDEFLTPGESFNDSIQAALKKSRLFVLAVTPNLVNESNYVMNVEYPMAKEAGKPILPAEMVSTDGEALQSCYPGIPEAVDPADEAKLTGAMVAAMRELAVRENDADPKHNFFIGLAYLGGIDVEVNHERAVELITGAAETGLTEAMEKLVSMYETGERVQRDYREAIRWRERLAEQARVQYEKTGTQEAADRYFYKLRDLGDARVAVADISSAKAVYETMRDLVLERQRREPSAQNDRKMSVSYNKLGNIGWAEGDLSSAKECYTNGMEIAEILAQMDTVEARWDLAVSYYKLGCICKAERNLSSAKAWYSKCMEIIEILAETGAVRARRALSRSYVNLGDICKAEGDLVGAKEWHTKGLEIRETLVQDGIVVAQRDLSISYNNLGGICRAEGDLAGAKEWYTKGLEIREILVQSGTVAAQRDMSISYNNLGDICRAEGNLVGAKEWYTKGMAIREILAQSGTVEARRDLSISYYSLGTICQAEGDLSSAKVWYEKALRIREKLAQTGTVEARRSLANSYTDLGEICKLLGDLAESKVWYAKALELGEILAQTGTILDRRKLSIDYENMGDICKAEGDLFNARVWYTKELEITEILAQTGTLQSQADLAYNYEKLGDIFQAEEDLSGAEMWYTKCLEIREKLAQKGSVESYANLALSYFNLGVLGKEMDLIYKAEEMYKKLVQRCPHVHQYRKMLEKTIETIRCAEKTAQ